MKAPEPLVSILLCAFNEEKYIEVCIQSCLDQTWPNIEVVLFNDGSKDATFDIVRKNYCDNAKVKILSSPDNVGKVIGFNNCYATCSGEYIHLMGGDDVMLPQCIEKCINKSREIPSEVLYHGLEMVDERLITIKRNYLNPKFATIAPVKAIVEMASVASGSWFIHRSIANKIFPIPLEVPYEDVWMSANIKNDAHRIGVLKEDLILYRQHNQSTFSVVDTSFAKVKFRHKRNLQYLNYIVSENIFDLKENDYEKLRKKIEQHEAIIACNNYKEVVFADLPWRMKSRIILRALYYTIRLALKR
ncbi:glycosyltransferase family 2 protein [Desulfobacterium sp. N47]|uniref:Glycosyltransferase 2-like domain-containing protein n=1 Tax=uncultured Desulfobacterium sp. TaxID=201089 RepID=E1YK51_9BACT|nr:hypothetical protein N47_E51670 [uncultured Desulfobacterium sp.]